MFELSAGKHRIACRLESTKTGHRVVVSCDGQPVIQSEREKNWIERGTVATAGNNAISRSQSTDKSLLLSMKRFAGHGKAPHEVELLNGILLWIDEKR